MTGSAISLIQRRWLFKSPSRAAKSSSPTDGAMAGAMIAVLAAPLLDLFAVVLLPFVPWPSRAHGAVDMGALLSLSWLTVVPLGALIGALGVRRWRRITGQSASTWQATQ